MTVDARDAMDRHIVTPIFAVAVAAILMTGAVAGGKAAPGQQPPADLTPPSISGTLRVGGALTASPGTWGGKGLKYAFQWLRCDSSGASCSAVGAASTSTYDPSSNDVGATLRVVVTASNRVGSAAATSSQTDAIAALAAAPPPPPPPPPPPAVSPSVTSLPTITGTVQQGQTLTGSTGTWSGTTPIAYTYQWQRCDSGGASCVPITGATATTYVLVSADVASTIRTSVTASNAAGSATASSVATAVVTALPPSQPSSGVLDKSADLMPYGNAVATGVVGPGSPFWSRYFDPDPNPAFTANVIDDPVSASGHKALSVTTQPTDIASTGANQNISSFTYWEYGNDTTIAGQGADWWHVIDVMFPQKAVGNRYPISFTDPSKYDSNTTFWEWHNKSGFSNPCNSRVELSLAIRRGANEGMALTGQIHGGNLDNCGTLSNYGWITSPGTYWDAPHQVPYGQWVQPDRWYRIVIHSHWSKGSDGLHDIFLNGQQIVHYTGPTLFWKSSTGGIDSLYPDLDNYHMPLQVNSTIWFRDWKMGSTAASVGFTP